MKPRRLPSGRRVRAIACLLAVASAGCSIRVMRNPPPRSQWPDPVVPSSSEESCTESVGPPVVDAAATALFGSLAFVERNSGSPELALALGVASLPWLASAVYGAVVSHRCRAYKAHYINPATGAHF